MPMKKGGYGVVYQEIMRNCNLSVDAKAIYAYLSSIAGFDNKCYPSMDTITHEMGITHTRTRKYINELVDHGIVEKERCSNGNIKGGNIYKLTHEVEEETIKDLYNIAERIESQSTTEASTTEASTTRHIDNQTTTNNNITNNSLTNNNITNNNKNNMVNFIDRICNLLNQAKAKAGSKGRLKAKGAEWHFEEMLNAGVSMDTIRAAAENLAQSGQNVDWYSFKDMLMDNGKGGI